MADGDYFAQRFSISSSSVSQQIEHLGTQPDKHGLKTFSRQVPQALQDRFFDLRVLYGASLLHDVSRGLANNSDITMKLRFLGTTEQTAKLYIVVQCEDRLVKRVKRFFAQRHVLRDLGNDFTVHVIGHALRRLAGDETIQSLMSEPDRMETLCGLRIRFSTDNVTRRATLGGLVLVEKSGVSRAFGLTVAHAIDSETAPVNNERSEEEVEPSDNSWGNQDASASDSKTGITTHIETIRGRSTSPGCDEDEPPSDDNEEHIRLLATSTGFHQQKNHDWALIELPVQTWRPNVLIVDKYDLQIRLDIAHLSPDRQASLSMYYPRVSWILSPSGPKEVELVTHRSATLLASGTDFVETLDFVPAPGSLLKIGDSGSWVVNSWMGHLYGYVVSVDFFGEAQVMPIDAVLRDIRSCLDADKAELPSRTTLKNVQQQASTDDSAVSREFWTSVAPPTTVVSMSSTQRPSQASKDENRD